jgi:hypothetical protein
MTTRGHGFEPRHRILDGRKLLFKQNGYKGSQMGNTKKNILKNQPNYYPNISFNLKAS